MSVWGKVIGGVAGFALGGPLGALLGAIAGHAVDTSRRQAQAGGAPSAGEDRQVAFTTAIIVLAAKLAKADGRVTRDEVQAFRRLFHIPAGEMENVARVYDRAKAEAEGFEPYARQVARIFAGQPEVLEELMAALFQVALADGALHAAEREFLRRVAAAFGFHAHAFVRLESLFAQPKEADPYEVLGLARGARADDVKRTYRQLVRENHPDVLTAKGMPKEFVDLANAKLAAINGAYEKIQKEQGIR